jgi:hypothetical protein
LIENSLGGRNLLTPIFVCRRRDEALTHNKSPVLKKATQKIEKKYMDICVGLKERWPYNNPIKSGHNTKDHRSK